MKRGILFVVIFLFCIGLATADKFGFSSESITMNVDISTDILITPTSSHYSLGEVDFYLTSFPRDTWQQDSVLRITPEAVKSEKYLVFSWDNPAKMKININSDVTARNDLVKIKRKVRFPITAGAEFDEYLEPTQNIESDDTEIIELASDLCQGQDDLYFVALELFNWVRNNVEYNLSTLTAKASQPASWVLKNRYGVCDEITTLFIAMSRSIGIPARYVSGIAYSNYLQVNNWQPHSWAELYFPSQGWVPFDITFSELGFVDATHVVLKHSADSNESTSWIKWYGTNVALQSTGIKIDTEINNEEGTPAYLVSLSVDPVFERVDFGSYNLIRARIKNLNNFYVGTEVGISRTSGLETISEEKRIILLKPNEEKNLYWMVKVSDDLKRNYVYTFPVSARTIRNVSSYTLFKASTDYKSHTLKEISHLMNELQDEEKLVYSRDIEVQCNLSDGEVYVNEPINAACNVRNLGNVFLRNLRGCIGMECHDFELGIGRTESLVYELPTKNPGEFELLLAIKSSEISKTQKVEYMVMDIPSIKLKELEYPSNISYDGKYSIKFRLEKNSSSMPLNITVLVNRKTSKKYEFEELTEKGFVLSFDGSSMDFGHNNVEIHVIYHDKIGRQYSLSESFVIDMYEADFFDRILIMLRNLELWLEQLLQ